MTQDFVELQAGQLSMKIDPCSGFLRYVRLGSFEVLRGIYGAIRDRNWGTIPPQISDFKVEPDGDATAVTFEAQCRSGEVDFSWLGRIRIGPNEIVYVMEGRALRSFLRNRIGLCVLHPIRECAGKACTIETVDGMERVAEFPAAISPHQPFMNLGSITHEVCPGVHAKVSFEGDTFETEDQRNWSDNSFKTYGTPLALPFPVPVSRGESIRQKVTLALTWVDTAERPRVVTVGAAMPTEIRVGRPCKLPRLGLGIASHAQALSDDASRCLRRLSLDHLRFDLVPSDPEWRSELARATHEAATIGASLHIALHLGDAAEVEILEAGETALRLGSQVSAWLILERGCATTSRGAVGLARRHLGPSFPGGLIAAGTDAYFAELNRGGAPPAEADLVSFSINPQVHAPDTQSIIETLQTQPEMVRRAAAIAAGRPVMVSPITLKPRFNPNATGEDAPPPTRELASNVDPRQGSLFAAGWTLGSIAAMASGGAFSATYYETTGWRGVMAADSGSPQPGAFSYEPGQLFPVIYVFLDLASAGSAQVTLLDSDVPMRIQGLLVEGVDETRILLANLTENPQLVLLPECRRTGSQPPQIRLLDAAGHASAASPSGDFLNSWVPLPDVGPITLSPYAYACVRF